jgi:DNA repair protein RecN (Recombination protein N)
MLALKSVLSAHDSTDVLVFDEIDANIGGEAGRVVGEKMRAVARDHQVVAITHLPQSAACGDRHLVVSKSVSGGRTRTRIESVEGEARVREIARMLGGASGVVAKHAKELLSQRRNAQ